MHETQQLTSVTSAPAPTCGLRQALTFVLAGETYGVDILRVQEIRGWSAGTKIPQAPPHILGVMNLRGAIVPIVDLRIRFALDDAQYTNVTVIIVLSVHSRRGQRYFGVVVDGVSDVVDVDSESVRPTPDLGARAATETLLGLLPVSDRTVMLLDIDRLLAGDADADVGAHSDAA